MKGVWLAKYPVLRVAALPRKSLKVVEIFPFFKALKSSLCLKVWNSAVLESAWVLKWWLIPLAWKMVQWLEQYSENLYYLLTWWRKSCVVSCWKLRWNWFGEKVVRALENPWKALDFISSKTNQFPNVHFSEPVLTWPYLVLPGMTSEHLAS